MTKEQILFSLLRSEIAGETASFDDSVTPELLIEVMSLAKYHSIEHIVANGLLKSGLALGDEFRKKCRRTVMFEIAIDARRTCALQAIQAAFEKNRIDYILLKGSVIRHLYPETWMRNSCDIDILVREEELDRAIDVLKSELDYTFIEKEVHDVVLEHEETRLELHFTLSRPQETVSVLNEVWSLAKPKEGGCECVLSDELFYYYNIAHLVKHLSTGGCGIRNFIDIWLLNQHGYSSKSAKKLLNDGGILTVTEAIEYLANVWFGDAAQTELSRELERFVLGSGTYGAFDNRVLLTKINIGGNFSYFLPRLFLPYHMMKGKYPVLKRVPILLPFLWIYRILEMLFNKTSRQRAKQEIQDVSKVDNSRISELQKLMSSLEVK